MAQLFLGIDIGTYSSKGVIVDIEGNILKSHIVDHKMSIPKVGWAEQDADKIWWNDVIKICNYLLNGSSFTNNDIAAIGLSAIGPCMLPLDKYGKPLRPGILYGVDTRASKEIETLNKKLEPANIFKFSGMTLSSQAVGPKIMWMKNNEPDKWNKVAHITTASSYLIYKLTGEKVIDRHTASHYIPLFDIRKLEWSDKYENELISLDKLPRLGWSNEIAGQVNLRGASETGLKVGTPVTVGAVDALSEAISVGSIEPGDLMLMYGSTAFFILVEEKPIPDKSMWTTAGAFQGQYNLAAGMATTGSLTRWFVDEFVKDLPIESAYATMFSKAEKIPIGSNGLIILPYFSGERTPINDPKARGIIAGLTLSHSRDNIFRAILEGVAYGIRHNIETFKSIGAKINRIIAVGGGTKSKTWLQIVSDVADIHQIVPNKTIGASYGDAFLAALASSNLRINDIKQWVKPESEIIPNGKNRFLYDQYYKNYLNLYKQTEDIIHKLA